MGMELNFFSQDTLSKDGLGQNSDLGSPELLTYPWYEVLAAKIANLWMW